MSWICGGPDAKEFALRRAVVTEWSPEYLADPARKFGCTKFVQTKFDPVEVIELKILS